MSKTIIRAAGGVLWRRSGGSDDLEVALVHRPQYDDWTLPKGKLHHGETLLAAAVREVGEETGAQVAVGVALAGETYELPEGLKTVHYWAMRYRGGDFAASHEVDDLRWLPVAQARARLSYERSLAVLDSFRQAPPVESTVLLIRHAKAGKRSRWDGPDNLRPLVLAGRVQAERLARFGGMFAPERVIAADRVRCVETVRPLAQSLGLKVEVREEFNDEFFLDHPARAMAAFREIVAPPGAVAICSQGTAIPGLLEQLNPRIHPQRFVTSKGAAWALGFHGGNLATLEAFPDAAD